MPAEVTQRNAHRCHRVAHDFALRHSTRVGAATNSLHRQLQARDDSGHQWRDAPLSAFVPHLDVVELVPSVISINDRSCNRFSRNDRDRLSVNYGVARRFHILAWANPTRTYLVMISRPYIVDRQVGFMLRKAHQRHTTIFTERVRSKIRPSQFAVLAKVAEVGPVSQNELGRLTAIDTATIKGVVDRLIAKGLLEVVTTGDYRRRITDLSTEGRRFYDEMVPVAKQITSETLEPLSSEERATFLRLLKKLG